MHTDDDTYIYFEVVVIRGDIQLRREGETAIQKAGSERNWGLRVLLKDATVKSFCGTWDLNQ